MCVYVHFLSRSQAADNCVGNKHIPKNFKTFLDKVIKRLIKGRREANGQKRKVNYSSPLYSQFEQVYKIKKIRVHQAIKAKQQEK